MSPLDANRPTSELDALRQRLAGTRGREYWQSLEDAAASAEVAELAAVELGREPYELASVNRRRLLQVMAASLVLGSLSGCGPEKAQKRLLPYIREPEGMVPAVPRFYASATTHCGYAEGILVKHYMGRPIKIEGNPDHPASLGATSPWSQAQILSLYDPERSQLPLHHGRAAAEEDFLAELAVRRAELVRAHGEGLRILTATVTSPSLAAQMDALRNAFPAARWHQWEPAGRDAAVAGSRRAFGRALDAVLHLENADIVLAVGGDFLSWAPGHLRYARDFAARRRATDTGGRMSRLYAIEATPTLAGSMADHRLVLPPDDVVRALGSLAVALGAAPAGWAPDPSPWIAAVARDLAAHRGAALVQVGAEQPVEAHVLGHAINEALGAHGRSVRLIEPVAVGGERSQLQSLTDLVQDVQAGKVELLLILDVNPVFTAPADLGFGGALGRVPFSVHVGPYVDETAQRCAWHLPQAHELEAWSDARAYDGTASIIQPQVRPLYGGRSAHEVLALLLGDLSPDGRALVQATWRAHIAPDRFDSFWQESLRRGVVADTAASPADARLTGAAVASLKLPPATPQDAITVLFRPDEGLWDGRFANNGWLQEMPRWHTKLVWDNAALISPATAERLKLRGEDTIEIRSRERAVSLPVWILPGQAEGCVTLPLGFGRTAVGNVGKGTGFDPYPLRDASALWHLSGVSVKPTGQQYRLVATQHMQRMAGRDMVISADLAQFRSDPGFLHKLEARDPEAPDRSLYPGYRYDQQSWAMAINLNSCIGCGACVIACEAENNTPVVGKEEVDRGRLMQWLRIDRYYSGGPDAPDTYFQPVPCMHCEQAPCEVVCPVQATVHDSDGLNLMVYNRCVGTRFCSNNCPYKVRRFNFFDYTDKDPRLPEAWNPDVTVRGRGVMEKCTYCVQRIREAKIAADRDDRPIRDGEVVTACQAACPTRAIVFGDQNDAQSAVRARKASPLDYALLPELNTRPRTTYEARLRNINPELAED